MTGRPSPGPLIKITKITEMARGGHFDEKVILMSSAGAMTYSSFAS
jgi:hypothetical protein